MSLSEIKIPALVRHWYKCPHCGTKLLIYDNTAHATGLFIKCRTCKEEIKIEIKEPKSHI